MSLESLKKQIFGITKAEAHNKGICIDCKLPALEHCHSDIDKREYQISGLCGECFDKI
jgi:hypothetical protein